MNHHPHTFHLLLVEEALKTVERILEVQRNPRLAEKVEHDDRANTPDESKIFENAKGIMLMS